LARKTQRLVPTYDFGFYSGELMSKIHIDLSQLIAAPIRTGIQRVEREALRHWPESSQLIPCLIDPDGHVVEVPKEVIRVLCSEDDGSEKMRKQQLNYLRRLSAKGRRIQDQCISKFLNLELFFDPVRADAHLRLAISGVPVLWYIYDFIPYLRPELFPPGTTKDCMHYLRALRGIGNRVAFLSQSTLHDYHVRILHRHDENEKLPVISPGANSLGLESQSFNSSRKSFVTIGTIEPRKNPLALFRAFEILWNEGISASLVVAGKLRIEAVEERRFLEYHERNPHLLFMNQPSDEMLREQLRHARAVVMPSEDEGFGLPPYEAVHTGIPAIASPLLPSAPMFRQGAILLEAMNPYTLADAIRSLCDDATCERLWNAAATVRLPDWQTFGRDLAEWACNAK
jgi:glycosyltransferase involved in cell wall biosynthesis